MSGKKLSAEEKVRIAQECHNKMLSIADAARNVGVDYETVQAWIRLYENEGTESFSQGGQKVYTAEIKTAAVIAYLRGGGSLQEICKKYKIRSKTQLRGWIKVYNAHGDFNSVKHSGGGSYMKQGRETTQEERVEIAKACLSSGKNYGEMALKYKVSYHHKCD